MEIRQTTIVLQSTITFIDKILSGRLILLGRGGHRTQKGQVALWFREARPKESSVHNVITQTHPKITSRLLPTLSSNAILRVRWLLFLQIIENWKNFFLSFKIVKPTVLRTSFQFSRWTVWVINTLAVYFPLAGRWCTLCKKTLIFNN